MRRHVRERLAEHESQQQFELGLSADEQRQINADVRHWHKRLHKFNEDLEHEPARVRSFL